MITLIAALDRNRAIGRDNALPWHLPADLKRFKALTLGKTVLMGRKTAQSLGRALPGRRNLVLSRSGLALFDGMQRIATLDEALVMAENGDQNELCVIGGAEIYALMLPLATRMYLTHVDTEVDGADVFFPQWNPQAWMATSRESHATDEKHAFAFEFVDYERRRET